MDAASVDQPNTATDQKRPRFQLCFSTTDKVTSKSDILNATIKLWGLSMPVLTPKFYSMKTVHLTEEEEREVEEIMAKLSRMNQLGPREKYEEPLLESHRYGWFQGGLTRRNPEIDRVHFPRRTSDMVKIQNLFMETKAKIGDRCE